WLPALRAALVRRDSPSTRPSAPACPRRPGRVRSRGPYTTGRSAVRNGPGRALASRDSRPRAQPRRLASSTSPPARRRRAVRGMTMADVLDQLLDLDRSQLEPSELRELNSVEMREWPESPDSGLASGGAGPGEEAPRAPR